MEEGEPAGAAAPIMSRFESAGTRTTLGTSVMLRGEGWAMTGEHPCAGRYTWLLQGRIGCCRGIALMAAHYVGLNGTRATATMCNHGQPSLKDDFDCVPFSKLTGKGGTMAVARVDFDRDEFVVVRALEGKWHGCVLTQGLNIKRLKFQGFKLAVADMKHTGGLTIFGATDDLLHSVGCDLDRIVQQYRDAAEQWAPGDAERTPGRPAPTCLEFHDWTPTRPEAVAKALRD